MFRGPCEVTGVETEGSVLEVPTTYTNSMDALGAKLSVGRLAAELEFSLLAVVGALGTRCRSFVPGRARNTFQLKGSERSVDIRSAPRPRQPAFLPMSMSCGDESAWRQ